MPLRIYNTLTKKVEEFKPLRGKTVFIYWCGQTVYDSPHLGHARTYIVADVLRRWLKYLGYNVFYVENITDIDDKIIRRAREKGMSCEELAEKYIRELEEVMEWLGVHVDYRPRATEHVGEMIELVEKLVEKGYAYEISDGVYFDVSKFSGYGKLSGQRFEDLVKHRVEPNPEKRNPGDFSLWKKHKPGEPAWDSPWGKGRPGWHIECSAMAMRYLGETFDIHGGGADLIFPHHENEIAQAEAATGKILARYWMHVGLLRVKGMKMAKSLGNFISIKEALSKWDSEVIRLYLLSTHYRKPFDFNEEEVSSASKNLERLYGVIDRLESMKMDERVEGEEELTELVRRKALEFEEFMNDDLNTPGAISTLLEIASNVNRFLDEREGISEGAAESIIETVKRLGGVLGILQGRAVEESNLNELIKLIVDVRSELRRRGDYSLSDKIRSRLRDLGIIVEDLREKSVWKIAGKGFRGQLRFNSSSFSHSTR